MLAALIGGVLLVYFASVPLLGGNLAFHFYLMLWITMASAFNVAAGFAGYLPFGYVAFYGVGAFTTAILVKKAAVPIFLALPLAGVAGLVLALLFAPTLRLSGIYFGIVNLALAGVCRLAITNMPDWLTGGSFGLQLGSRAEPVHSFYVMMAVMVAALATILWLARSRLGKALRATRDDPDAADMMGVNVPRIRLYGWLISAVFPAICGGIEAWYTNVVDTETAFNTLITAKTVIYAVAGGLGTVTGPVVGAVAMVWLDELIWRRFPLLNLLILGVATVALVLFLPRGIVGTLLRRKPQWRRYVP
ncbi:MAG TPA: branched-chain amino acid ABC transporter permease [Vineibacter sp.]|nr:branched-chain amino acid ABC transporter permease [Vineibacter sp.]